MRFVYASGSDFTDRSSTHASGNRMMKHAVTRIPCLAIPPHGMRRRRGADGHRDLYGRHCERETVDERAGRLVAAAISEDGGEDGDAEDPANSRGSRWSPGRLACLLRAPIMTLATEAKKDGLPMPPNANAGSGSL